MGSERFFSALVMCSFTGDQWLGASAPGWYKTPTNRFYGSTMFAPTYIGLSKRGYKPDEEAEALCPELSKKGCPDPCASSGLPAVSTMSSQRPPLMHWHDESPTEGGLKGSVPPVL